MIPDMNPYLNVRLDDIADAFTIACKKGISNKLLKLWMKKRLPEIGLRDLKVYYFCDKADGGASEGQVSWHIGFSKSLTKNQVCQLSVKLEDLRRLHRLGAPDVFLRWDIFDAGRYLPKHLFLDIQTIR